MIKDISYSHKRHTMTRRKFLWLTSLSAAGVVIGCATNPVTGKSQLMLVSESQEKQIDKEHSPHQFSADYGISQDRNLNRYINRTGKNIATRSHRPDMPYSFNCVNATYINAYAFPGGSIATTRGILLTLDNEAELAALLGHELGHVNARHTAEQMSKGMLIQSVVGGVAMNGESKSSTWGKLVSTLGMMGAGALLASYSRDNEREADALGIEYMTRSNYSANGMVGLMEILKGMSKHKLNAAQLLFATHPMSDERYKTAVNAVQTKYRSAQKLPLHRERYMDHTARLRKIKGAIKEMQNGEREMVRQKYRNAETHFNKALKKTPRDYAGLVMMSKCQLVQNKYKGAQRYAGQAKKVYPKEGQAYYLSGFAKIKRKKYNSAYEEFKRYDVLLPGNSNTTFYKGYTQEKMQHIKQAAEIYHQYLQLVNQGEKAQYAYKRLVEWGYIKP